MIEIKEWTWKTIPKKEMTAKTITCPYCGVRVQASSTTRIVDTATGAIKYQIHKCPECFMQVITAAALRRCAFSPCKCRKTV